MLEPSYIREVFNSATCLYSKEQVEAALNKIAQQMNEQFADENPLLLCVMTGGVVTLGCLLPRLNFPLEIDYIHVTRYQKKLAGQTLVWKVVPTENLTGRTVIIVDDILDGGITLNEIVNYCRANEVKAVYTAVLVDKKEARIPGGIEKADFNGLVVDNYYVFGYGLDYEGYLRNAPGIYRIATKYEMI